ncbi:class I lanthipeptide [Chitinophaga oryzae]|uniref:Class I lanthipeptide n=1 Tax=Chitinophaga oryzae TaxID=2725414 RepID=A0AAE6ZEV4_9BACT|nr:class I lanthipeptide [Chitinophaga oryzae]QJB31498.1 class I lanthipeptide [Chitinophaga oryzae]QJB37979.1 class I lanthipeptide [Chitinophaga oryzae]
MKKKMSLNKKLTLAKNTVGVMTGYQQAAIKGGRLTTIGRTCQVTTGCPVAPEYPGLG